jgi:hypothetical protein
VLDGVGLIHSGVSDGDRRRRYVRLWPSASQRAKRCSVDSSTGSPWCSTALVITTVDRLARAAEFAGTRSVTRRAIVLLGAALAVTAGGNFALLQHATSSCLSWGWPSVQSPQ